MIADLPLSSRDKLFCFGMGYSATALAGLVSPLGVRIAGTHRASDRRRSSTIDLVAFDGKAPTPRLANHLAGTTHVLVSIPPDAGGDVVVRFCAADLAALPSLKWIGYLSTVGVYGDTGGAWVDETARLDPRSPRATRRVLAETQWRGLATAAGIPLDIFRLPGIYGPGRSAIDQIRAGTAHRVIKPGQVFNRVHVADIAGALAHAMARHVTARRQPVEIYNLADDEPAPPQDVVACAAALLGLPPPPDVPFAEAALSDVARSFYAENRRVSNRRLKADLGYGLRYPTYREGLLAIHQIIAEASQHLM